MGAAIVNLDVVAANVVDTASREHPEATQWYSNALRYGTVQALIAQKPYNIGTQGVT